MKSALLKTIIIPAMVFISGFYTLCAQNTNNHLKTIPQPSSFTPVSDFSKVAGTPVKPSTADNETSATEHPFGPEPDWVMKLQPGHVYNNYYHTPIGDVNGDGYDDYMYSSDNNMGQIGNLYFGSPTGLKDQPDWLGDLPGKSWLFGTLGDINGDGYSDIFSASLTGRIYVFLGSATGPPLTPSFDFTYELDTEIFELDFPLPLGDLNGDGFDDFALAINYPLPVSVFYGAADNDYTVADYTITAPLLFYNINAGDFNGDGYADIYVSKFTGSDLYFGGPSGLSPNPGQAFLSSELTSSGLVGDFNGDGYDDLVYTEDIAPPNPETFSYNVLFVPGSSTGLQLAQRKNVGGKTIVRDQASVLREVLWNSSPGDINNDGFDDFKLGDDLYYGGKMYHLTKFVGFYTTYSKIQVKGMGDLNGDGNDDLALFEEPEIFYSPAYEPLSISCQSLVQNECFKGAGYYTVPELQTTGHIQNITYYLNGIFTESNNASGYFNGRDSYTIIWSALGYNFQELKCTTSLRFIHADPTGVTIKSNSAHPKGDPNTFYIGYGAEAFRIEALPAGGGGPYTYLWSNGSTEKNPRISEKIPGEYPYWVKMKNVHGCESSDSTVIKVENALCSSPLVDVVMSQYPAILQNQLLANLIKSNSKIAVCKDGQTMCFTKAVVDIRISRAGYTLGACTPGVIPAEAFMTDEMEEILRGGLKVIVAPNPSSHAFQLNVVSIYNEPVMIRIMDLAGRQVEVLNNASSNQTLTIGHKLRAGTYIAEVISGKEREVVKLVKMQ